MAFTRQLKLERALVSRSAKNVFLPTYVGDFVAGNNKLIALLIIRKNSYPRTLGTY